MLHQLVSLVFGFQFDAFGLWSTMGTGKSKVVIDWLRAMGIKDSILLVAPNPALENWREHFRKDARDEYDVLVLSGTLEEKSKELLRNDRQVYIINYDALFRRNTKSKKPEKCILPGLKREWNVVIFDESRMIKSVDALRTKISLLLASESQYRIALAGLPISKSIEEFYTQQFVLDFGEAFGDYREFMWANFDKVISRLGFVEYVPIPGANEFVRDVMYSRGIRFTADEVLDLPEKVYITRMIDMAGDQRSFYLNLRRDQLASFQGDSMEMQNTIMKFHQICGGWVIERDSLTGAESVRSFSSNAKLKELLYLMTEELRNEKVLVFAKYVAEQHGIFEALLREGFIVRKLVAGMSPAEVQSVVTEFNSGELMVVVASPRIAGRCLDLIGGHHCIFYSEDADYELMAQCEDRMHRKGQKHQVIYIRLICAGTADERIREILSENKRLVDVIVEGKKLSYFI
jgi:SNF2 family DNA or RNA helicase